MRDRGPGLINSCPSVPFYQASDLHFAMNRLFESASENLRDESFVPKCFAKENLRWVRMITLNVIRVRPCVRSRTFEAVS